MNRKKLGIDLDTTLNNLEQVWLKRYNEDYGDNLKEWTVWDLNGVVKPECGVKIFDYLSEPGFFYNLDIKENAIEVVKQLSKTFDIYIVTAYKPCTCVDKVNWVKKFLPMINPTNIIFCNDKSVLNLDYLIDDGPHNIIGFKQTGIIFDMPYNRDLDPDKYPYRVNNWRDIKKLLTNIEFSNIKKVEIDENYKKSTNAVDAIFKEIEKNRLVKSW